MTRRRRRRRKLYRVDRVFRSVGRIARCAPTPEEMAKWDALLTKLYETGRLEIMRQLKAGTLTFREVLDAERRDQLHYATDSLILSRPLWTEVGIDPSSGERTGSGWLPHAAKAPTTCVRYATAWRGLLRTGVLGPDAQIRDLATVRWDTLHHDWPTGPTGWNHVRRAVSRFLTTTLNRNKFHPFRLEVMRGFPYAEEPKGRVPDISVEQFWAALAHVPAPLQPCYVTMAAGGLGPGEYLRSQEHHLMPHTRSLRVVGTKFGRQGEETVRFGPRTWEWVVRSIPAPVCYETLLTTWKKACTAVGLRDHRLYDLRHCHGQWTTEAGVPEARVGKSLRHRTASTTRIYTDQRDKGEVAAKMDELMFPEPPKTDAETG